MKLPFLIVTFFLYVSVNGQSIEGKYCWSFKNKFMGQITRCLDFDGNGRFISELITDVGIIEEGDYEVLGDKLIMIYDLEDNTEYVKKDYEMFNIKKNEGWSFEKYYEISTGVKFGERLKREFIILKNKTEKLKLKNLATKKRITLYKNFS